MALAFDVAEMQKVLTGGLGLRSHMLVYLDPLTQAVCGNWVENAFQVVQDFVCIPSRSVLLGGYI